MQLHSPETVVLAGGCFWGLQELLRTLPGVLQTDVGYCGGKNANPTYDFHPGHAEAVRVTFDPTILSYAQLLDYFFRIHDPTTANRQGNDTGSSYRSAIFIRSSDDEAIARDVIERVQTSKMYPNPVVTTLEPAATFYSAEDYHQDYLQKNPGGYTCHFLRSSKSVL